MCCGYRSAQMGKNQRTLGKFDRQDFENAFIALGL